LVIREHFLSVCFGIKTGYDKDPNESKGFLEDLGTIASCYPFSFCLSVLLSAETLRTLVVLGTQPLRASKLFKKKKTSADFFQCEMDANLIQVATEGRDTAGLAHLYHGTFD
jgi:hypothetical protein